MNHETETESSKVDDLDLHPQSFNQIELNRYSTKSSQIKPNKLPTINESDFSRIPDAQNILSNFQIQSQQKDQEQEQNSPLNIVEFEYSPKSNVKSQFLQHHHSDENQ
jgi:hypothetical protein